MLVILPEGLKQFRFRNELYLLLDALGIIHTAYTEQFASNPDDVLKEFAFVCRVWKFLPKISWSIDQKSPRCQPERPTKPYVAVHARSSTVNFSSAF